MRIVLTGASGFVGSHVLERLLAGRHTVAILHRPDSDLWRIEPLLDAVTPVVANLSAPESYREALRAFVPEAVVHLAWWGVGGRHRNDTGQIANLHASLALLEAARQAGATHWVGLGSQAEYGPLQARIDERAPTRPTTLYGAAKLATFHLAQQLCAQYGIRFAWLRLFSSYGPKDHPQWLLPYLTLSLLERQRPALTKAEQRWDYVYVTDAAEAICRVVTQSDAGGAFNLGRGEAVPLREVVETLRDLIDPALPLGFGEVPYRPDQVMHLEADIGRLTDVTGWRPTVALNEGLQQTVEWYRANRQRFQR